MGFYHKPPPSHPDPVRWQLQYARDACERILKGKGKPMHWAIVNKYAPAVVPSLVRELCLRKAGINSCPNCDKDCRCETCRYWGA